MRILTPLEIRDLTGRSQAAAQIRWLSTRKWTYEVGGDGLPKVSVAHFERRMGALEDPAQPSPFAGGEWQVDAAALRRISSK